MRGKNRVTLVGNLGKDPEVKTLSDGVKVARMALATTDVYRTKDGTTLTKTEWHTIILWRSMAGLAEQYLKKGSLIFLEGKLRYRKFQDKEGLDRFVTEIVADELIMLDKPPVRDKSESDISPEDDLRLPF